MKKILVIACAASAFVLAGCNQGGTSDEYSTGTGMATNAPSQPAVGTMPSSSKNQPSPGASSPSATTNIDLNRPPPSPTP